MVNDVLNGVDYSEIAAVVLRGGPGAWFDVKRGTFRSNDTTCEFQSDIHPDHWPQFMRVDMSEISAVILMKEVRDE